MITSFRQKFWVSLAVFSIGASENGNFEDGPHILELICGATS